MKKLVLILCSIAYCTFSYSQNEDAQAIWSKYSEFEKATAKAFADKDYEQAKKTVLESLKLFEGMAPEAKQKYKQGLSGNYYNLTCAYSLLKNKKAAIESFENAVEYGYSNYSHANKDTDLDYIRKDKKFIALMEKVRLAGDYLYILKQAGKYQTDNTSDKPEFKYEYITNQRIQDVKKYFKLDSIAGNGDEISKIKNIMLWVHNTIPHDGSNWPLCEIDAIDIYNYSKANNNKGVNCRALAIVLNECYLSMGFKSRFITCMPKDENDGDCHVINSVYSTTLNKWLWMDPSFNAYVTDENGNLLSIAEVRERQINNLPVVLNKDANWNNKNPQTKEWYLDNYMAKNLYWLQCPALSYFNIETRYRSAKPKYVSLMPIGYEREQKWLDNYTTNDSDYFWQAPDFSE